MLTVEEPEVDEDLIEYNAKRIQIQIHQFRRKQADQFHPLVRSTRCIY